MIDFATLQGVAIPEGVVTQIESGGVVLWKAAGKKFVPVFDFGTVKATEENTEGQPYAKVTFAAQPSEWANCTHFIMDGVAYEATYKLNSSVFFTSHAYTSSLSGLSATWFKGNETSVQLFIPDKSQHVIQLGYYAG